MLNGIARFVLAASSGVYALRNASQGVQAFNDGFTHDPSQHAREKREQQANSMPTILDHGIKSLLFGASAYYVANELSPVPAIISTVGLYFLCCDANESYQQTLAARAARRSDRSKAAGDRQAAAPAQTGSATVHGPAGVDDSAAQVKNR